MKVNQQKTAAEKFFGVDTEMKALKVKVEQKDNEIAKLKQDLADGVGQSNSGASEQLDQLKQ